MATRCDFCGGRFGLIRHRQVMRQFCTQECKESDRQRRERMLRILRRQGAGDQFAARRNAAADAGLLRIAAPSRASPAE